MTAHKFILHVIRTRFMILDTRVPKKNLAFRLVDGAVGVCFDDHPIHALETGAYMVRMLTHSKRLIKVRS